MKPLEIISLYTSQLHGITLVDDDTLSTVQIKDSKTNETIFMPREDFYEEFGAFVGFDIREDADHISDAMESSKFRASLGSYCRWTDDFIANKPNYSHSIENEVTFTC